MSSSGEFIVKKLKNSPTFIAQLLTPRIELRGGRVGVWRMKLISSHSRLIELILFLHEKLIKIILFVSLSLFLSHSVLYLEKGIVFGERELEKMPTQNFFFIFVRSLLKIYFCIKSIAASSVS